MATESKWESLIHVGLMPFQGEGNKYLFLRKLSPKEFAWFIREGDGSERVAGIAGETIEEAMRLAQHGWREEGFHTLNCGFRYTLPERDEHGSNALFYQMAGSYASFNGVYFDVELGGNCIVHNASLEARALWEGMRREEAH